MRNRNRTKADKQRLYPRIRELESIEALSELEMRNVEGGKSTTKEINSIMNNNTVFTMTGL